MYPTDQSISSYSSNPSTPVNSPPPLTSQHQQMGGGQQQHPHPMHGAPSTTMAGNANNTTTSTWQQLTPVVNGGSGSGGSGNSGSASINAIPTPGGYTPELVSRGLHLVSLERDTIEGRNR